MAYELSKELHYKAVEIQTPLGIKKTTEIAINWYLFYFTCWIPMHTGFKLF
jgi:uracil phosphoribosyltransferase